VVDGGPFIQTALICEKVLREADGVLSIIRVIDRFTITAMGANAPETIPESFVAGTLLLSLKSGFYRGSLPIKLVTTSPSGVTSGERHVSALLEGDDRGVNLIINLRLAVKEEGVFWIGVYGQDQLLTQIPLRIVYQRVSSQGSG
jgi:hypothetical protein